VNSVLNLTGVPTNTWLLERSMTMIDEDDLVGRTYLADPDN